MTPLWVLYPSEIMRVGFAEPSLAGAEIITSIRVLGWQRGAPKPREHDFPKKKRQISLKFIGPVTPLVVLYPSEIMHMGFTELLLARAVFTRSKKVPGWQPGAPKFREHDLPKKNPDFFEIHRTSDDSMGSAVLPNRAYGLYKIFTSQSSVHKVN